jgi:hypothetical protein
MAVDAEMSPAAIEGRCRELREAIDSGGPLPGRTGRTWPDNLDRKTPAAIVAGAVRKYLKR